ncbi:MAG: hypothetical protein ACAH05_06600 [Methylophilus sp.]|nr:hypothetical protein [Methylophilus sp.]
MELHFSEADSGIGCMNIDILFLWNAQTTGYVMAACDSVGHFRKQA